jgi:hypothetical protein
MPYALAKALQDLTDLETPCKREATPLDYDAILLFLSKIIVNLELCCMGR